MNNVWRFTGPPENWITAFGINNWALNENNKSLWENRIRPGDTVIFHSTASSEFSKNAPSSIIGFGYVGEPLSVKDELWWLQEVRDGQNHWPYVVPLKEIYLFSNTDGIDFKTPIQNKSSEQVAHEIRLLTHNAVPISALNKQAQETAPETPNFPVNGSASGINPIYEQLILEQNKDFFSKSEAQEPEILEKKLAESLDEKISTLSKDDVLSQAQAFDNSTAASHAIKFGERRIRKENQVQKRRVAYLEDYSCQVCGFKVGYVRANGKEGWIVHVDHIVEKSTGANEKLNNLWVLCPNCHAKKTYGVIKIDPDKKVILLNDAEIKLHHDSHLGW